MKRPDENKWAGVSEYTHSSEQTVISTQLLLEDTERSQSLFGLGHKLCVGLEDFKTQRIVDMRDADAMLLHGLSEEHILIAIVPETQIKGICHHNLPMRHEVGCVEVGIRFAYTLHRRMLLLASFLITESEVVA